MKYMKYHAFMNSKEPLCEHDYTMFDRSVECVVDTNSTMVNCKTCLDIRSSSATKDPVNHPSHYIRNGIEVLDVIEAFELGFNLGNVVKYVCRADFKSNALEDLKKARVYLNREIAKRSK